MTRKEKKATKRLGRGLGKLTAAAMGLHDMMVEVRDRMLAMEKRVGVLWEAHDTLAHNCTIVGIGGDLGERLIAVEDAVKHLRSIVRLLHKVALGDHTEGLPDSIDEPVRNLPLSRKKVADALVSRMAEEPFYTRPLDAPSVAGGLGDLLSPSIKAMASKRNAKRKAPAKRKRISVSPKVARDLRNAARRKKRADAKGAKR